jgi:hypothetical protein
MLALSLAWDRRTSSGAVVAPSFAGPFFAPSLAGTSSRHLRAPSPDVVAHRRGAGTGV